MDDDIKEVQCPTCGKTFFPTRPNRKYCSRTCMRRMVNRRYYKRNRREVIARVRRYQERVKDYD